MKRLFFGLSLGLVLPLALGVAQQPQTVNSEAITQISVQRTECYGTCPIEELVLNSDDSATYSGFGHTPRGGFFKGQFAPEQFSKLAAFLEEQNFLELRSQIGDGNITDVPDLIISATRGAEPYAVAFRYDDRKKLGEKLAKVLFAAGETIRWQRDALASSSGIKGTLTRPLTRYETNLFRDHRPSVTEFVMPFTPVTLRPKNGGGAGFSTRTDGEGRFRFFAPPGDYNVSAYYSNSVDRPQFVERSSLAKSQVVTVESGKFAMPKLKMEDITRP